MARPLPQESSSFGDERLPVGVLALQGSFPLHVQALARSGAEPREVRKPEQTEGLAGLIIPGGESTVLSLLARSYGLYAALEECGRAGMPLFGTCAGAILLGTGDDRPPRLGLIDVEAVRNAYGRQVESFTADVTLRGSKEPFHAVFIRAPRFRLPERPAGIEVLGTCGSEPVLLKKGPILIAAFHPELGDDLRVHRLFLEDCRLFREARATAR